MAADGGGRGENFALLLPWLLITLEPLHWVLGHASLQIQFVKMSNYTGKNFLFPLKRADHDFWAGPPFQPIELAIGHSPRMETWTCFLRLVLSLPIRDRNELKVIWQLLTTPLEHALQEAAVPVPAAYSRQVSFGYSKNIEKEDHDPNVYVKREIHSSSTEVDSLKERDEEQEQQQEESTGKTKKSVLIFIQSSRIYIRVAAILIMLISFSLILTAVIMFGKAQNKPGHPLDNVPHLATITDRPCLVFTGVAVMNLLLSVTVLSLSCLSSKVNSIQKCWRAGFWLLSQFNKSNNAISAVFAILSAIGFSSAMGACFFLNKETSLQNDLWKWSCGNHKKGIVSDALDFNLVCHVVSYGWKFGLVQASLELLTFIISIIAFILLKYAYFARYGSFGKVFWGIGFGVLFDFFDSCIFGYHAFWLVLGVHFLGWIPMSIECTLIFLPM
jgi:hypothetical protein